MVNLNLPHKPLWLNPVILGRKIHLEARKNPLWLKIAILVVYAFDIGIILQKFVLPIFI